jgi:purine-binding chemotaxis protein CheW
MQAVLLPVGPDWYALPVDWVRQVVAVPSLTRLVTAPGLVRGLFNLRGEIVPLLDTARLLGLGDLDDLAFAAVLNAPNGPIALAATAVPERTTLDAAMAASELSGTAGTYAVDDRVVVMLDPRVLITEYII